MIWSSEDSVLWRLEYKCGEFVNEEKTDLSRNLQTGQWSNPPPPLPHRLVFINQVLLEPSHTDLLCIVLAAFTLQWQRGVIATETLWPTKPKYLLSVSLKKMFSKLWTKGKKASVNIDCQIDGRVNEYIKHTRWWYNSINA